ncbi:uncharacterized protein LOC143358804 [Halictus rubicundus]|uniref:uncharacterized protein LOC143358804 n=1 Tax=Halictus rubicundus TaxID=77578 RepID=UPI0040364A39
MNEECPSCKQIINTSCSRLIKDSCGHNKCRMCLIYEEQGCKICNNEHIVQNIGNYDCQPSTKASSNKFSTFDKNVKYNEEVVLPLELVIKKHSKYKANDLEFGSISCINDSELSYENPSIKKTETYNKSAVTESKSNISDKLYACNTGTKNVVLNAHTFPNQDASMEPCYNERITDRCGADTKTESLIKEKLAKSKSIKSFERNHILILPGLPERYKCSICNKIFHNKKGKCYHDACVTGIRPYKCSFCDRTFIKRSHFEYHERVHKGYKPYKCNLCEKAFPQQNKLNRHMYSHSKEKQFVCPQCNKRYTKKDDLRNHLNTHNGTARYSCKACEKTFGILTNLKRHLKIHTNERPHTCEECNKSFKDKSLLIRHKKIHGKYRPFSCAHCSRVFLSKSELRRHLTVHSDEKPFSCTYCQTVFRRKDNLHRHIRHHHPDNPDSPDNPNIKNNELQDTVSITNTNLVKSKLINSKQKQKPKKSQKMTSNSLPKQSTKVSMLYASSNDQINSRLDSMGNITPVIRTTSEVSNAVPVINGPISARKTEDKTDTRKKTFTYTEPIPLAEAVVINRRIEEKLYPQNVSNHNYFFRNYLNCADKSHSPLMSQTCRTSSHLKNSVHMSLNENSSLESGSDSQTGVTCHNIDK